MFADRVDAGRQLAEVLMRFEDERPVVLALPRGGVPIGAEIARALHAPLDLILVRKIGVPFQPELAAGAIVDGREPVIVWNRDVLAVLGMTEADFDAAVRGQLAEIQKRRQRYLEGRTPVSVAERTAIVVDDGIATGATMKAALRAVRLGRPRRLLLAVPVAPAESLDALAREVDEVVCLETPEPFLAIGAHYYDFAQLSDEEVVALLHDVARAEVVPPIGSGALR